jgi:hypothetical protein
MVVTTGEGSVVHPPDNAAIARSDTAVDLITTFSCSCIMGFSFGVPSGRF